MDLRREFDELMTATGHFVLLQRGSRKIRCSCWNEKNQEAVSTCPKCLGLGRVSRIERHQVRKELAANIINLPGNIQTTSIGQIATDTRIFYFRHNVQPKKGDVIMEVGWNGQMPTHLIQAFEISYANDHREQNGRVEYWETTSREFSIDTPIRAMTVRKLGPIKNYEIVY